MNLRVILLERMSKLKTGCFDTPKMFPQETLGPWLALGHFDAIYTYGLGTEQNIFSAFGDSSSQVSMYNDDRRYFHPLHLISERDDTLFWDTPSWYLSIARIHLSQDAGPISEIVGKLGSKSKTLGLFSQIYYTVELSDIVLVLKADRLNPLLDFDLTLRQFPEIGKVYTYTGIDFGKLKNPLLEPPKEHIPFFSMRFSVNDFYTAAPVLDTIRSIMSDGGAGPSDELCYSVAGVDDAAFRWTDLPSEKLIQLFRSWCINWEPDFQASDDAFSSVTTRVGIPWPAGAARGPEKKLTPPPLRSACDELAALSKELRDMIRGPLRDSVQKDDRWLLSLTELANNLARMSDSAVLDNFVFVMLPGARAFLKQLKYELSCDFKISMPIALRGKQFVDHWTALLESILRLEGQLTHHPEIRPILYDIPISSLEYIMAFASRCTYAMGASAPTNLMLVPCLHEYTQTQELFPVKTSSDPTERPGLVLIYLPLHTLREPQRLQSELCHELAHFVGESYRMREARVDYYFKAAAVLACKIVLPGTGYHPAAINELVQRFQETRPRPDATIRKLEVSVLLQLHQIVRSQNSLLQFYQNVTRRPDILEGGKIIFSSYPPNIQRYFDAYRMALDAVTILFREIYADICMLALLNITSGYYVQLILNGLKDAAGLRLEAYVIRICVALKASGREQLPSVSEIGGHPRGREVLELVKKLWNDLDMPMEEYQDTVLPLGVSVQLLRYSRGCCEKLRRDQAMRSGDRKRLLDLYRMNFSSFEDFQTMQEEIITYRREVLSPYDQAGAAPL